jgi:uncharacterized protein (TIGR02687 family)
MDELNLQEIENKLKSEFESGERIVFWYDADASFEDSVDQLQLGGVKVMHLTDRNAFRSKITLEHDDADGQYLVYAPFAKPDVAHNHLEDTLLYSKQFYADKLSLIAADIGLPDRFRASLKKMGTFFGIGKKSTKEIIRRTNDFIKRAEEVDLPTAEPDSIELLALCVIARARNVTVDDLMYAVFSSGNIEEQGVITDFEKAGIADDFWKICSSRFGYEESKPTLLRLLLSMFAVHVCKDFEDPEPKSWKLFLQDSVRNKTTNISVLLDNMMNNVIFQDDFDMISEVASQGLDAEAALTDIRLENLVSCTSFMLVDELIIKWIISRELAEDKTATLSGMNIPELCDIRKRKHFGKTYAAAYDALVAGYELLQVTGFTPAQELSEIAASYISADYKYDTYYRKFIAAIDALDDSSMFDDLKVLMQNIYQNDFLEKIVYAWNLAYVKDDQKAGLHLQSDFYRDKIASKKEKTVVIISDALRYEAAQELSLKFQDDPNCEIDMSAMMGTLPSYTAVGMAALLPHDELTMTEDKDHKVLVDGEPTTYTEQKEKILKKANEKSAAILVENILNMSAKELKEFTAGKEVIYIYHNKVDSTGENSRSENTVLTATGQAIDEIYSLVKKLSKSGNVYRFYVTADHGFIYSRKKLEPTDKLKNEASHAAFVDRRFIIDDHNLAVDGVFSVEMSQALHNEALKRYAMFAKGMSVFTCGGGMNYVHGGSSPEELIIPLLFIKTQKGLVETEDAKLNLITDVRRITNLRVKLDFYQEQAVSDIVKKAVYRLKFESDDGEIISNEVLLEADSKDDKPGNRIYTVTFDIKRKTYDPEHKYFLKVVNEKTGVEYMSRQVIMDLPFTQDFGF